MQGLSVLAKVLCTRHQPAHLLQDSGCAATDLAPCPAQTVDRRSSQCRDNGCQG